MRIGILLSTLGGSPLQVGLERGLLALGHRVEAYHEGRGGYDLLLVFNQTAHTTQYHYPMFPVNPGPVAFIDTAEFGYFTRLPDRYRRYANTFAPAAMAHDTKNKREQERLRGFLEGRSFPYFLREFHKCIDWPAGYHPIDYPLYLYSEEPRLPDREEYLKRDLDLFVSWGASHPWRLHITEALRRANTKCEIQVIGESLTPQQGRAEVERGACVVQRMPQPLYFERTRAAKCSVSFDGYGSGSFRVTEVLVRTLLLQGPLSIHRYAPLVDGVHCREYRVESDGETFVGTDVAQVLRRALDDPEGSYAMYEAGYAHCLTHYTERATAQYVLDVAERHDWTRSTVLDIGADYDGDGEGNCLPAGE